MWMVCLFPLKYYSLENPRTGTGQLYWSILIKSILFNFHVNSQPSQTTPSSPNCAVSRAANAAPELRCRIRGEMVIEHAVVHPSITAFSHPGHLGAATSIPMMAWGKLFGLFTPIVIRTPFSKSATSPAQTRAEAARCC
jgi:chloramphenicol O-acetyltransferase